MTPWNIGQVSRRMKIMNIRNTFTKKSHHTVFQKTGLVLAALAVSVSLIATPTTQAASCDTAFYSANDILFFNPCAANCSSSPNVGTISTLSGDNNAKKIYNFWVSAGLAPQQAAGITGSMKHEGGFSPFRQEDGKAWESGGWGIAQFTFSPGQRADAKAYVSNAVGADIFNQYYKNDYGGPVLESQGFVPSGVPQDINDKFLLGELNYLLDHIKQLKPNSTRAAAYQADFGQTVDPNMTLYNYLTTQSNAGGAAIAWTYLYEYPGDIKATALERSKSAEELLSVLSGGSTTSGSSSSASSCGSAGLVAGGLNMAQAKAFMQSYVSDPQASNLIGGAGRGCPGGELANCVSFSAYFINKYTTLQGFASGPTGNGNEVVGNIAARNPSVKTGTTPKLYAVFSLTAQGSPGHTGVILGIDTDRKKVIVGEASCGDSMDWIASHNNEYDLAQFSSGAYTYAYTDGMLKGTIGK